jgi:hypothetical protein
MSGLTCSDHASNRLGESALCRAPAIHPLGEFFSYSDGRVAVIKNETGGKVTLAGPNGQGEITLEGVSSTSIENTRKMQGAEVGDCMAQGGGGVSFEILPTDGNITWTASDQVALNPLFGGRVGRVFLCSDTQNRGTIGINNSKAYNSQLIRGFKTLQTDCSSVLGEGSADKCAILKGVADLYVPKGEQSTWEQFKGIAGYLLGGLFVFIFGAFGGHLLVKWWDGRGGPKGGGGSGGGGKPEGDPRVVFPSEPQKINVAERRTHWEEYAAGATILVATALLLHRSGKGKAGVVAEEGVLAGFRRVAARYAPIAATAGVAAYVGLSGNEARAATNGGNAGTQVEKNKATLDLYGGSE